MKIHANPIKSQRVWLWLISLLAFLCLLAATVPGWSLGPGDSATGTLTTDHTSDVWPLVIPADGTVTVTLTQGSAVVDFDLNLYDTNGTTQLQHNGSTAQVTSVGYPNLQPGTYFAKVYRYSGEGGYTVSMSFTAQPLANDAEPNDAVDTPVSLPLATPLTGHLGYYTAGTTDAVDWYAVTVTADGALAVTLTHDETADLDLDLYDVDGTTRLQHDGSSALTIGVSEPNLMPGTYFARVYRYSGYAGYTLSATTTVQPLANDAEPNDAVDTPVSLPLATPLTGHLGYYAAGTTDAVDWYAVTVPADGALAVTLTHDATADLDLDLYDVNGTTRLQHNGSSALTIGVSEPNLTPGTYYVTVYRYSGFGGYTLSATTTAQPLANDAEPNDAADTPVSLPLATPLTGHLGYYAAGTTDVVDWYAVTVPADGALAVTVTHDETADLDLDLYDVDGTTRLQHDGSSALTIGVSEPNLMPGTYYVAVYRYSGYGGYTLSATTTAQPLANDAEPNDAADTPVSLPLATPLTGHLGYYAAGEMDTADWYAVTVPADGALSVTVTTDATLEAEVYLFDTNGGTRLDGDTGWGSESLVGHTHLMPGTYYVQVYRWNGYGGYTIEGIFTQQPIANDREPNDDFASAQALSATGGATGHLGYYSGGSTDGEDYFAVSVPSASAVDLEIVTDETLEADVACYDAVGQRVAADTRYGMLSQIRFTTVAAGTYYLRVYRWSGYGGYRINQQGVALPDAWIRATGDTAEWGNDLYNDAPNQTRTAATYGGVAARYWVTAQNDAAQPMPLTVTGPDGDALWTVRYFDSATNTEITAAVTGAGWSTEELATGQGHEVRVEVTPQVTVAAEATYTATVTVAADAASDSVVAVTTRRPIPTPTLAALPAAQQTLGKTVTLTAGPVVGRVQFQFRVGYKSGAAFVWTTIRPYADDPVCTWRPTDARIWSVVVWAREAGSTRTYDTFLTMAYTVVSPLSAVGFSVSPGQPRAVQTPITLSASPVGGTSVIYRFRVGYKSGAGYVWNTVRDYAPERTCVWTPTEARSWSLAVYAKESNSTKSYDVYKTVGFVIHPAPPTGVALTATPTPGKVGSEALLQAAPTGGTHVQYRFRVARKVGSVYGWQTLQEMSDAATCRWTPTQAGTYTLAVYAKEVGSSGSYNCYKAISFTVKP
jgi:hypothetical protein